MYAYYLIGSNESDCSSHGSSSDGYTDGIIRLEQEEKERLKTEEEQRKRQEEDMNGTFVFR